MIITEKFSNIYKNKKVLITGHTGFKGSWLTSWLIRLNADIVGISNDIPTKPSMFELLNLKNKVKNYKFNISNLELLKKTILDEKPDFLFHLAAQPLVSKSYIEPNKTILSNVMGTSNVLESLRFLNKKCNVVLITSDKSYENIEMIWGYKETDTLGGKDIYSGSKGAAELIIKSYYESFFINNEFIKIAIARAGNVIGGGDWAKDRIVADSVRAWSSKSKVKIRNPLATRPWQHVLEPISGYLQLGMLLEFDKNLHGEAFNFGPEMDQNYTVLKLLQDLGLNWGLKNDECYEVVKNAEFKEAGLLKLNCEKALTLLNWRPSLSYIQTIDLTGQWYKNYYVNKANMNKITEDQITFYENLAEMKKQNWIK